MAQSMSFLITLLFISSTTAMAAFNIVNLGAKPDGQTDSARPFLRAWAAACQANKPVTIYVPQGRFFLSPVEFLGPCKNKGIKFLIHGTIVAPAGYSSSMNWWIRFKNVDGLSIYQGTLDGRGQSLWACKMAGRSCPFGATSLSFSQSKNVLISGLTSINSKFYHLSIFGSSNVKIQGVKITAPDASPNTDGIHLQMSSGITIKGSTIGTGDDCIAMKAGMTDVWIEKVRCGPGHGISIGSLGDAANEAGVQNITVRSVVFTGTQNGVRIKTWGKPNKGSVNGVTFANAIMQNVQNPIIIDQNYCPSNRNCPGQSSGVKISRVSYTNIRGSSATPVAVKFDCSPSNPCSGIGLKDIKLRYQNKRAQAFCKNVRGTATGFIDPPSCF
ncbi:polygalacturonase-like [Elaeis guineensis]|uniref:Exopolygalacturonase n=1 Tax=Elaeis guineensis var. tenera TaxID=51953 RepID=A0A6I9RQG8_ELAGV|nr:polygalacturonase [Elaeis guineensis]